MSLYRELVENLPFDPTEREGLWGYRRADHPHAARWCLTLGAAIALALAVGLGPIPAVDWGGAIFWGLVAATASRALLHVAHRLRNGGWHAWRGREVNAPAVDLLSGGAGVALALLLATGGGGVGPAFALGEALFIGLLAVIAGRALLLCLRWP